MDIPRIIWLTSVAAAVSAAVSVATVCVVVPMVVDKPAVADPAPSPRADRSPEAGAFRPAPEGIFAVSGDPRQEQAEAAQDREAVAAIKDKLGINLFSGPLLQVADAESDAESTVTDKLTDKPADNPTDEQTDEQTATDALLVTAEQLEAAGQSRAADLVRDAADRLRDDQHGLRGDQDRLRGDARRAAAIDSPLKPR
jgi:hypothetical protein